MVIVHSRVWRRWWPRLVFLASAAVASAGVAEITPLPMMHPFLDYHFFDLRVYRAATFVVVAGRQLYKAHLNHGLGFTYPPFAVLAMMPLRWLDLFHDEVVVTAANLVLVAVTAHAAVRLRRPSARRAHPGDARAYRGDSRAQPGDSRAHPGDSRAHPSDSRAHLGNWRAHLGNWRAHLGNWRAQLGSDATPAELDTARAGWIAAAIAIWAEPVISTLGYGQIDLLIAALVTVDLAYGRDSRIGGLGIGLAAALKLTPLIFIPYLLLTRRGRMGARALATFVASIVVAFIALPRDASSYWGGTVFDFSRVTGRHHLSGSSAANQSLRGALLRLFPGMTHVGTLWLPACLLVACVGLLLAALAARRGNDLHGLLLAAITGLLVSPVSWTHHWTIVVPAAIALATTLPKPRTRRLLTLLAVEIAVASSAIWIAIKLYPPGTRLGAAGLLLADLYVVAGLAVIATAAAIELQRAVTGRRARFGRPHSPQPLRVIPEPVSGP